MADNYYIRINGKNVPVSKEVYQYHKSTKRKMRTQKEKDKRNNLVHYEDFSTATVVGEELIYDPLQESTEELVIEEIVSEKLRQGIESLSDKERSAVKAIYFQGLSEERYSEQEGISQTAASYRRRMAIKHLKKFLEKN